MTDKELAYYIQCGTRFAKRAPEPLYSPSTELLYKAMLEFLQEIGDKPGSIFTLLRIYDGMRGSFPQLEDWKYKRDRDQLTNFIKAVPLIFRPSMGELLTLDGTHTIGGVESHMQQMHISNNQIHITEYSADYPNIGDDAELNPINDIKALMAKSIYPECENVYIAIYQLHGGTLNIFRTKEQIENFRKNVMMVILKEVFGERLRDAPQINIGCPSCALRAGCDDYQKYCVSLGQKKDIIALLIRRSIVNGLRMEASDELYKLNQAIKNMIEERGIVEDYGVRFTLLPKVSRRWDPVLVREILEAEGLWSPAMLKIDDQAINRILVKKPDLIAKLQRAVVATETSYNVHAETELGLKKKL